MTEAERTRRRRVREKEALQLREESKLTFREIGKRFGVGAQTARCIYMNGVAQRNYAPRWEEMKASLTREKQTLRNLQVVTHCFYSRALSLEYRLPDPFVDELI